METRVFRGPNYWSYDPTIKMVVDLGLAAGRLAVRIVNHLVEPDSAFAFAAEFEQLVRLAERAALGPSTQAILDEANLRDIPWIRLNQQSLVQLGHGVHQKRIRAT